MTDTPTRFTLRQLPLPAKLVLSCFLCTVGLGYFSAMVQLHLQHSSRNGEPLPGPGDVVAIFAGKEKADPSRAGQKPVSKFERLIMGPVEGAKWNGQGSMAPAFFHKDGGGVYTRAVKENPGGKDKLDAQRNGERDALRAWANAPADERLRTYETDSFLLPEGLVGKPVTPDYLANNGGAVKVKRLVTDRCVRCHGKDGSESDFPLETYAQIAKYLDVPAAEAPVNGWVRSDRQIGIEKLTQSTHAHLLSFAMLFTLTGLVFAFSSYSTGVRCVLAPLVLVAQVIDVACWWLARIDGPGVYFALAIIGTGTVVGIGLSLQIVLGLLNMYGPKGKVLVWLLLIFGAVVVWAVFTRAIAPGLQAQKDALAAKAEVPPPTEATPKPAPARAVTAAPMPRPANGVAPQPVSQLERLVMGSITGPDWDGSKNGSMAGAFFHRDEGGEYRKAIAADPGVKGKLDAERNGERNALRAWMTAPEAARKAAYAADRFPLPADLAGAPLTAAYRDGPAAKVKAILTDRCVRCHVTDGDAGDFPLETYEQLLKYLGPEK